MMATSWGMSRRNVLATAAATVATISESQAKPPSPAFSAEGLAKIQPVLEASIAARGAPGIIAIIWRKGEIVQINTAGYRDIERNLPVERDTIFRIASMSKPITVAAALTLVDQGKMALSDPITKWVPEFSAPRVLKKV